MKIKIIKDKLFYLSLISLAVPIMLQDFLKHGLNLVDNIMVGMLSETELSAANLANQPFFLFNIMIFGIVSGGTVLISQYYGKNNFKAINKIISIILATALSVALFFTFVILVFPDFIMRIFTDDNLVILTGEKYLKIVGWTYLLYGISSTLVFILRGLHLIKTTLLINAIAFFINVILDWCLIFGNFGFSKMGIEGAAFATLIARILEAAAIIIYINRCDKRINIKLKNIFCLDKNLFKDFISYGFPVFINDFIWAIGILIFSVILGHLDTQAIAASSITGSVEQFVSVLLYGISNAACILIGNEIGAGKKDYAKKCSDTLVFLSTIIGFIIGVILFLSRSFIVDFYNIMPDTKNLAMDFMSVVSTLITADSVCLVSLIGILRGGGDTKFAMCIDVLSLWLISIPFGVLFAFVFNLSIVFVFFGLHLDILVKAIFCLLRLKSTKWIKDVTR